MTATTMKEVHVGLVRGRHKMPVEEYIFESVEDVFDFDALASIAAKRITKLVDVQIVPGPAINGADYTNGLVYESEHRLVLYTTGLTAALAAVIKICAENGVYLTLKHYDCETYSYVSQKIF